MQNHALPYGITQRSIEYHWPFSTTYLNALTQPTTEIYRHCTLSLWGARTAPWALLPSTVSADFLRQSNFLLLPLPLLLGLAPSLTTADAWVGVFSTFCFSLPYALVTTGPTFLTSLSFAAVFFVTLRAAIFSLRPPCGSVNKNNVITIRSSTLKQSDIVGSPSELVITANIRNNITFLSQFLKLFELEHTALRDNVAVYLMIKAWSSTVKFQFYNLPGYTKNIPRQERDHIWEWEILQQALKLSTQWWKTTSWLLC